MLLFKQKERSPQFSKLTNACKGFVADLSSSSIYFPNAVVSQFILLLLYVNMMQGEQFYPTAAHVSHPSNQTWFNQVFTLQCVPARLLDALFCSPPCF